MREFTHGKARYTYSGTEDQRITERESPQAVRGVSLTLEALDPGACVLIARRLAVKLSEIS